MGFLISNLSDLIPNTNLQGLQAQEKHGCLQGKPHAQAVLRSWDSGACRDAYASHLAKTKPDLQGDQSNSCWSVCCGRHLTAKTISLRIFDRLSTGSGFSSKSSAKDNNNTKQSIFQ